MLPEGQALPTLTLIHRIFALQPTVLREKQANLLAGRGGAAGDVSGIKTPNGQLFKNAKQSIKQTPQNDKPAPSRDENLSQSAKNRALLSRLKGSSHHLSFLTTWIL